MTKETNIIEEILKRFDEIPMCLDIDLRGGNPLIEQEEAKQFLLEILREVLEELVYDVDGERFFYGNALTAVEILLKQIDKELTKE